VNGPIAYLDVLGNQVIKVSTPTAATQVCASAAINEVVKIPAWSADGKRLAYCVRDGAQSRIETRDANCGDVRIVFSGPGNFGWIAWNPAAGASQRELAFTVDTGQGYRLDAINEDGTGRRTLVTPSTLTIGSQQVRDLLAPAYSSGGQFLAFIADISSTMSFVVVTKADGTNPQPISSAAVRAVYAPRWTARGDAVACGVVTMTTYLTEWHFYPIVNGAPSGPPVIWNNSDIKFLSFSPDGLRVCGARNLPGIPDQLFVGDFDVTTFAVTNIAGLQTRCTSPSWGPVCV
jgi:Tol biopolymer transport system component